MDVSALFDQLLQSGRDLVAKSQGLAERKLDIPSDGPQRDSALSNIGKGAAMAGVAALLLGTRAGRGLSNLALKLGSLGAIGGLAYKAYQDWQGKSEGVQPDAQPGPAIDALSGPPLEKRSALLLKAMIAAAKADGHIDEKEQDAIDAYLHKLELNPQALHLLKAEIARPLDAKDVAADVDSLAAASEVYLTSLLAIDLDNDQERAYLEELARELKLPSELVLALQESARS